jgi:signal peptidase I
MVRRVGLWVGEVIGVIFLAWIVVYFCFQTVTVHGESMMPSYADGDRVVVNKLEYRLNDPKRLDPVLIELDNGSNNTHYTVKRVIGCPGETLQIQDGSVYINGEKIDCGFKEEILSAGLASYEIELGEDEYFIMGDNCNNSEDSRVANIGNIKREQFVGKVVSKLGL